MDEIAQPQEQSYVTPPPVEETSPQTFPCTPALEMTDAVRDEISKIVQNLYLPAQGPRRVVFAGTESGSGCSWMCARVAEGLAPQGRGTVCVVGLGAVGGLALLLYRASSLLGQRVPFRQGRGERA